MLKRFIIICLLITAAFNASADVFTVTSNADAGAGTLRQALTLAAANGSATQDYIYFNIADQSEAGRTIILKSELPYVSSNLVIDGTTQPGLPFKTSDAKIALTVDWASYIVPLYETGGLTIRGVNTIEIYGLYIYRFSNLRNNFPSSGSIYNAGILIYNSQHIIIGAPGKGNMFSHNSFGIFGNFTNYTTNDRPSFVTMQSNYFGFVNPDGTYFIDGVSFYGDNLIFGGDDPTKGNYVLGGLGAVGNNDIITNNFFGLDKNKQPIAELPNSGSLYPMLGLGLNNGIISNNLANTLAIRIEDATNFKVISNTVVPGGQIGITINNSGNGTIGTDDLNLKNILGMGGISAQYSKNIEVRKNSITCANPPFIIGSPYTTIPDIKVLINNNAEFSGTASPNSTIYIYNDNTDCDVCSPVEYLTTIIADATGKWKITGDFTAKKLLANATLNQNSSEYTIPFVDYYQSTIVSATCGLNNGAIKLLSTKNVLKVEWFNTANNQKVGEGEELKDVGPGIYYAVGYNNKCTAKTQNFYLYNYTPDVDDTYAIKKNPSCGQKGSITQLMVTTNYEFDKIYTWRDKNGGIVGNTLDIDGLDAGEYTLTVKLKDNLCQTTYGPVILQNIIGPSINESNPIKTPSSCTIANGSIHGVTATGTNVKYSWKNEQNVEVGTTADLDGQPAGKYMLTITDNSNCGPITSSPIEILSANDISINTTTKNVLDANCDNSDGAITNIQVTGTGTYLWTNEQGVDVGHNKDLTGVPTGKYKLTVSSANCPPVSTELIEILSTHGITINDAERLINKATCQYDNGGISNIQVTGATKYTWYNASNVSVSNNLELAGMPTGNYYLIAANNNGCSKQTVVYTITRQAPINYGGLTKILKNATCDENNGSIEVIFQNPPPVLPDSYKWVNTTTGQVVNTSTPILTGIDAGKYDIYGITNGCEQYLINYSIGRDPGLTVVTNNVHKNDDHCASSTGSIKGIQATGATPLSFIWTDDNGINRGASVDLLNITAGTYHLKITDGANCEQGFVYTIYDQPDNIAPPTVNDVQLCSSGSALLSVSNADSKYGYRLYEDNNSATPIDEQQNGSFKVNVKTNRSYYISQYVGNCESSRQEVHVLISGISGADIANTFTPNGDGINDYWEITGMENYTNGTVKVFNRDGKMVYQSKGYAIPFDGTLNGKPLPAGVYYYIIDLKSCNLISGNLTILR